MCVVQSFESGGRIFLEEVGGAAPGLYSGEGAGISLRSSGALIINTMAGVIST